MEYLSKIEFYALKWAKKYRYIFHKIKCNINVTLNIYIALEL